MNKNFEVLLSKEAKAFIKSLDIKLQKKIAYNIQKSREVNDAKILKKLTDEIWEFRTRYDKQQTKVTCILGFKFEIANSLYSWIYKEDSKISEIRNKEGFGI